MDHLMENFDKHEVDGYNVYLQKFVDVVDDINIRYVQSLFFKTLVADGVL